jgi:osmotically-inducible protein OsmY
MTTDSELKKTVLDELSWEPSVNSAHIGVTAHDGVITLTGHVERYADKQAAETAAGRVKGVKAIAEQIEVRFPYNIKKSDEDIAAAVADRLSWNSQLPKDTIMVKVEKGWVTLSGKVDWYFQKISAENDIRHLLGVSGVSNTISISPTVSASDIGDSIDHALNRSWFFDDEDIDVRAEGGKVHLTGWTESWHDRQEAEKIAWSAPGVTAVQNDIRVS